LFALMPTRKLLQTWLLAVRDRIFARSASIWRDLRELSLAAWAVCHNVRGARAVAGFSILSMARLLAMVNTTIESAITRVSASEHASPFFNDILTILGGMLFAASDFIATISAEQSLFNLATVAASIDTYFASSA
jgi:hypothetical protein